ncbi:MAG: type II toxin-antitoxin system VapC family toxin [Nitrosomonadales bacterium]|nr:type II toxin-antitoxin system VapC family toxin [Nitrosomonadales bacterium]
MGTQAVTVWLFDSNAIMGYLNQDSAQGFIDRFEQALVEGAAVSVITTIEVLGWRGHDATSRASAESLLQCMGEIPLSASVVQQTIALRSRYSVKLPDAVIAATALTAGLKLMTRNQTDFERIEGLVIINPFANRA